MGEAGLKSKFELMCRLRRAQIFRGFKEWILRNLTGRRASKWASRRCGQWTLGRNRIA